MKTYMPFDSRRAMEIEFVVNNTLEHATGIKYGIGLEPNIDQRLGLTNIKGNIKCLIKTHKSSV